MWFALPTGDCCYCNTVIRTVLENSNNQRAWTSRQMAQLQIRIKKSPKWKWPERLSSTTAIKQPDCGLQLHMGQRCDFLKKCPLVWWSKNWIAWPQWPSLCLEEKGGGLEAKEHHTDCERRWRRYVVVVRDWCTSQDRWHHEHRKLCEYNEAASQDISQEVICPKWCSLSGSYF